MFNTSPYLSPTHPPSPNEKPQLLFHGRDREFQYLTSGHYEHIFHNCDSSEELLWKQYVFTMWPYWPRLRALNPGMQESNKEVFLRLNKFSLYGHICRTLGPETYFSGIMNSNLSRGLYEHNNNEFSFSQIYMGLEETIF